MTDLINRLENAEGVRAKRPNNAPVYAVIYPALAELARRHGYALAVHGSLARDFDLVCIPWIAWPSPIELVINDITDQFALEVVGGVEAKEHGRLCQTLAFGGDCFLDLSFMPMIEIDPDALLKAKD